MALEPRRNPGTASLMGWPMWPLGVVYCGARISSVAPPRHTPALLVVGKVLLVVGKVLLVVGKVLLGVSRQRGCLGRQPGCLGRPLAGEPTRVEKGPAAQALEDRVAELEMTPGGLKDPGG